MGYDDNGIIWPKSLAPFDVAIIPINMHKSEAVADQCESLYTQFKQAGLDPLFMNEPKARLGSMLADAELIGLPHLVVVGDRGLEQGMVEYKSRQSGEKQEIAVDQIVEFITAQTPRDC